MDLIIQRLGFIKSNKIKAGKYLFNLVFLKDTDKQNKLSASDVVASVQWTANPRGQ
ncbi:MAG: hypothetical protein JNL11_08245 [Bdellovibrionaceae bacterium]|nr:hypothetical protein [Pseudobdellovibrionaceae bacterium]